MVFRKHRIPQTAFRIYPLLVLFVVMFLSPLPESAIAIVLLLSGLYFYFRKPALRWEIPLALGYFFAIPLLLQTVLHLFSPLVMLPAIPMITSTLKENALNQSLFPQRKSREFTMTSKSVTGAIGIILFISVLLGNGVLAITGGIALSSVAGILIYVLRRLPLSPLEVEQRKLRVIAGATARITTKLENKAKIPVHTSLMPSHSWIHLDEDRLLSLSTETKLTFTVTPPLAGPSHPEVEVLSIDPWGLIQIKQVVKPINLYVIPRARYAEWLARKYLEETASRAGTLAVAPSTTSATTAPRGGVEYHDSRPYQPGDRLKDIDWKHTIKLREIVVKEYGEDTRRMAIIVVNLAAANPEEADKLVYNLITAALTLAREAIPTALAAYNQEQVLLATPTLNPREVVKKTLQLGQKVTFITPMKRYLQPINIKRVRISLRRLEKTNVEPARKLKRILELEKKAADEGVKGHPATLALTRTVLHILPPATIIVISAQNHDSEALAITLEELKRRGFSATTMMPE